MALKPRNDREMKGLEGSNHPLRQRVWLLRQFPENSAK